jgi:hypothetical protein
MIALVGCVKTKIEVSAKAKDLYLSPLFKKTVSFIKSKDYNDWFILSAKYGLIDKEAIIDPYELTLLSFSQEQLKEWSDWVFNEIKKRKLNDLHFYCGSKYHNEFILQSLKINNIRYSLPLKGLSLGQRLSYFNKQTRRKGFFT